MEIWIDIKGYEGLYQVSNLGRVRSLNYLHTGQTRLLSLCKDKDGYLYVTLCKKGKRNNHKVHRLVANAFLPNWFDEPEVNHCDENKNNNNVDNLEWCDRKYNANYGTATYRSAKLRSTKVLQFTKNGELVKEWSSLREADRNGYKHSNVGLCCRGVYKQYKGYIWKYKEVV